MPLSTFDDLRSWQQTIHALHQAVQVVGKIQGTLLPKRRNYLHLAVNPQPYGVESQMLPDGIHLRVDYRRLALAYLNDGEMMLYPLADHTQVSLFDAVTMQLRRDGVTTPIILNDGGTTELTADAQIAAHYADAQDAAFTGIARFRARLEGHFSPVVIWPHHFDISTLLFAESNVGMDEGKAHINLGYAPFTEGQYERPYLYAYASPVTYPANFHPPALPAPAFWNAQGWQGAVVTQDDIARQNDPVGYVECMAMAIYEALLPLIGS